MAIYTINISINTNPVSGDTLKIINDDNSDLFDFNFYLFDDDDDDPPNAVFIGQNVYYTMNSLRESFNQLYNLQGLYLIDFDGASINIIGDFAASPKNGTDNTDAKITVTYTLENGPLVVTGTSFLKHDANTCGKVDVEIITSVDIVEITEPPSAAIIFPASSVNIAVGLDRNYTTRVGVKNSSGDIYNIDIATPGFLNAGLINISKFNNSIVIESTTIGLDLMFSLTGNNYVTDNVFTDLLQDNYILFVKDQFECNIQIPFEITNEDTLGSGGLVPEFTYSKSNSIRIFDVENIDDNNVFKNRFNSSSCGNKDDVIYKEVQNFRSWDIIKLQIKSNYDDLLISSDEFLSNIPLVKITENINLKRALDAKVINLGNSKSGIYFISGKTYDYDTLIDLNNDYSLNGEVPEWGKTGNVLTINNFNYVILNVIYDDVLKANYLEINRLFDGTDLIVKSQYNLFNYDIFEFFIIFRGKTEFNLQFFYNGQIRNKSELLRVNDSIDLSLIKSFSDYNTDMFFASGIKPIIRVALDGGIKPVIKNSNEEYFTDEDSIQTDFENYEVDLIKFLPVTKELSRKIVLFLSQSNVYINGILYRRSSIDLENLDRSNLVVITAEMVVKKQEKYKKDYELLRSSSSRGSSISLSNSTVINL